MLLCLSLELESNEKYVKRKLSFFNKLSDRLLENYEKYEIRWAFLILYHFLHQLHSRNFLSHE